MKINLQKCLIYIYININIASLGPVCIFPDLSPASLLVLEVKFKSTENMALRSVYETFWSEWFWLPANVTWKDLENKDDGLYYPQTKDLYIPLVLAFIIFAIRKCFERWVKACDSEGVSRGNSNGMYRTIFFLNRIQIVVLRVLIALSRFQMSERFKKVFTKSKKSCPDYK